MKICVFCSARTVDEKLNKACLEVVKSFATSGHDLVWGGSNTGLMKQVADMAQNSGSKLFGVSVEMFKAVARNNAEEMIFAKDLGERKGLMLDISDMFLVFPGGLGTLDEIAEIMELKKNAIHSKPIAFLNIDGYFNGLLDFFDRMEKENMVKVNIDEIIEVFVNPQEMISYIDTF